MRDTTLQNQPSSILEWCIHLRVLETKYSIASKMLVFYNKCCDRVGCEYLQPYLDQFIFKLLPHTTLHNSSMVNSNKKLCWFMLPLQKSKGRHRTLKTGLPGHPGKLPAGTTIYTVSYFRIISASPESHQLWAELAYVQVKRRSSPGKYNTY